MRDTAHRRLAENRQGRAFDAGYGCGRCRGGKGGCCCLLPSSLLRTSSAEDAEDAEDAEEEEKTEETEEATNATKAITLFLSRFYCPFLERMQAAAIIGIAIAVVAVVILAITVGLFAFGIRKTAEAPSHRNRYRNAAVADNGPFAPSSLVLPSIVQTARNTAQMSSAAFGNHVPRNVPFDPFADPVEEVRTFRLNPEGLYVEEVVSYPGYGVSPSPREAVRLTEGRRGGGAASEHVLQRKQNGTWRYANQNDGSEFIVVEKSRRRRPSQKRKRGSSRR
jgi:hypothetical protein